MDQSRAGRLTSAVQIDDGRKYRFAAEIFAEIR